MKKFPGKKIFKKMSKKCKICGEDDYSVLDTHRVVPGKDGGKYTIGNSVCLCVKCHRKVHAGKIIIKGLFKSTQGRVLIIEIDGEEKIL